MAASANFPVLLLALTWRRFNSLGVVFGIAFGLISSILLIILSPMVWSPKAAAPFPLRNPAIVSVPIGFLGCLIGRWLDRRELLGRDSFDEVRVLSTTGLGGRVAPSRRAPAPRESAPRSPWRPDEVALLEMNTRVGLIVPSSNTVAEVDFYRHLPVGATFRTARMYLDDVTPSAKR